MERLKKYLPFLMFSCKKTSELIDKSEVLPLNFKEKAILLYHNTICRTCHHYKQQSKIIDNTFNKLAMNIELEKKLSHNKKSNLIKILDEINE